MTPPLRLRVFLASPGDVSNERSLAREVLGQLPYDPLLRGKVEFEIVAWDQPGAGVPMLATMTPQAAIAAGLPKPSECDIVVVIFWSRMGTPLPDDYERKPDGTPYLSGTEWECLDAIRAAEAGGRPVVLVYRRTEKCLLDQDDPEYEEKRTQYQRVKSFFAAFRNPDGSIRRGCNDYAAPDDFRRQLDQHLRDIVAKRLESLPASTPVSPLPLWQGSPFPGLRAFTPADAPIFFGRGRETDALVRRLADPATRFIAVVAASGSGKSSLVAAGLLPRLKGNAIVGSKDWLLPDVIAGSGERKQWTSLRFTPGETGDNPFLALAVKLAPLLPDESLTPGKVAARLESEPTGIQAYAADTLRSQPDWAELLLFVDQFEELFSVVAEAYRAKFVELLAAATDTPRVRTVVTMRSDFYHRCLEWPKLAELLREATFPLAAPGPVALGEMITRPAARAGLDFEVGLPDRILQDTGSDPGALALLAFALHELYEARTTAGKLTLTAYAGFDGVKGAISQRAETTFAKLLASAQALLGTVFRDLVEVDQHGVATRRRAKLADVASSSDARDLVDAFTDARLLVTDRAPDGTSTVEVAHEALLREWERLAEWIRDIADDLRLVRQAEAAAAEWERLDKYASHLWPHERLVLVHEALEKLGTIRTSLAEPTKSFLRPETERLLEEIERPHTTHYRRAEIGDRLDRIGDPRSGIGLREDGLPDIVWCEVPPGAVTLEDNAGTFEVTAFKIAKYPITYAQYKAFLDDPEGYARRELWWQGLTHEDLPGEQYRPIGNCPADNVSWHDAMAFCRWLDARLRDRGELQIGRQVRLPMEWEWQQAATGGHSDREYPWGPDWIDGRANTDESRLSRTTAVGMYAAGASPVGALDLAGNVWEWCLNKYEKPSDCSLGGDATRVLRGGSWVNLRDYARCACRDRNQPGRRYDDLGFRVVLCASPVF
ncbi:MAG: SUMF1/EgtB/PvdO family nonheme iron enzyme [Burkholderiales bacterium]|nr:SUMF1/EgtB/PvdO family nonheme iron enzyme [Burkholderiales bacterium]